MNFRVQCAILLKLAHPCVAGFNAFMSAGLNEVFHRFDFECAMRFRKVTIPNPHRNPEAVSNHTTFHV